ncbi:MAG TPA: choice-of-anchor tandem repeat GloVer-containing protein [Pirellulales bacterium]|jgi:uncharacterized repeat protein (TIGR03803 family)|nr:choice-of-anchor tandem repeat GloVer-containing protein [Pirellulales bacterium]
MTPNGGAYGEGNLFSLPAGGGTPTNLVSFGGTDGAYPAGSLTLSADGSTFYGMTNAGGLYGDGTIFSVPLTGGTPTTLLSFDGANGESPVRNLTLGGSTLYGMTPSGGAGQGTVFSISTDGSNFENLLAFSGTNGAGPQGSLTLSADGSTLYGMTTGGGANFEGVIFSIPAAGGAPTNLGTLDYATGANPYGNLTLVGSTLYGLTHAGGADGDGAIFSIPTSGGTPTNLFSLDYATNGSNPYGSLTLGGSTFYGMANGGGADNYGTVLALALPTPEPSSLVLLGLDAIGLAAIVRRGRSR